jgi:hypothetical protein
MNISDEDTRAAGTEAWQAKRTSAANQLLWKLGKKRNRKERRQRDMRWIQLQAA